MALSKEKKDMLAEMYRGKDLYDPSEDKAQDPLDMSPHMMNEGGYCMAHGGYCMAKGGEVRGQKKVGKVMHEFGKGKLHSSSGEKVKDRDQAIAIAMSEAGLSKNKAYGGSIGYANGGLAHQGMSAGMSKGGPIKLDTGGAVPVEADDAGPIFSFAQDNPSADFNVESSTDTNKQKGNISVPTYLAASNQPAKEAEESDAEETTATPAPAQIAPKAPVALPPSAPAAAPMAANKLSQDQFNDLINNLQPSRGQGVSSAVAGLADAIMQGVSRAGNPGFQRNIEESRQNQRQNLINALKAKYETQFRGQELAQGQERISEEERAHKATEKETERARELTERGQNITASREQREASQAQAKQNVEAAQKVVEAYEKGGYNPFVAKPSASDYNKALNIIKSSGTAGGFSPSIVPTIKTQAQYDSLPKGTHYRDSTGKEGIKK